MKRQLLLSLSLSILAANAFALPANDQQARSSAAAISQSLTPLAEGGSDRLIERNNRVADSGADVLNQRNSVAEGGSDRLIELSRVS